MIEQDRSLASGFLRASREFPLRPALEVDGQTLTYVELEGIAAVRSQPRLPSTSLSLSRR